MPGPMYTQQVDAYLQRRLQDNPENAAAILGEATRLRLLASRADAGDSTAVQELNAAMGSAVTAPAQQVPQTTPMVRPQAGPQPYGPQPVPGAGGQPTGLPEGVSIVTIDNEKYIIYQNPMNPLAPAVIKPVSALKRESASQQAENEARARQLGSQSTLQEAQAGQYSPQMLQQKAAQESQRLANEIRMGDISEKQAQTQLAKFLQDTYESSIKQEMDLAQMRAPASWNEDWANAVKGIATGDVSKINFRPESFKMQMPNLEAVGNQAVQRAMSFLTQGGRNATGAATSTPYEGQAGTTSVSPAAIGALAQSLGMNEDAARAAMAIAMGEGGLQGAVGDKAGGGSFGPFQLYAGGELPNYASAKGLTPEEAKSHITSHPMAAAEWALKGYLGDAIRRGQAMGLTGPDLAAYAQQWGQRSAQGTWDRPRQFYNQLPELPPYQYTE